MYQRLEYYSPSDCPCSADILYSVDCANFKWYQCSQTLSFHILKVACITEDSTLLRYFNFYLSLSKAYDLFQGSAVLSNPCSSLVSILAETCWGERFRILCEYNGTREGEGTLSLHGVDNWVYVWRR